MTLGIAVALLVLALRAKTPTLRLWLPALGVVVVVLDLFAANRPLNVVPRYEAFPYNPLLDAIPLRGRASFFRVQDDAQLPGHAGCAYGYRGSEGVTPYQVATYARFLERASELVRWQLLGVQYVVTWRDQLTAPGGQLIPGEILARGDVPDAKGNVAKTHRLKLEPRRAFLVHRVEATPDDDALWTRLADPGFDPFSLVLLPVSPVSGDVSLGGSGDRVSVLDDVPGGIQLSTTSDADAVLVVSEAHFPGWRVTVDGRPAPLLRADGALLAVRLPSGAHEVEFTYRPDTLAFSGVISGLAALLALGLGMTDYPIRKPVA
jgi:hypothetical protein